MKVSSKDFDDGKGPWWLDDKDSGNERKPSDMKDAQLKKAVELLRGKVAAKKGSIAMK